MTSTPTDLKYTREHEWVRLEGTEATLGMTDFDQKQLGGIVAVELPTVGEMVERGDALGTIESVKAVSEIYMPVTGTISAVNQELSGSPELINDDPYGEGWIVAVTVASTTIVGLLSAQEYDAYTASGDG
jgi:glycine cleavage system H protein